MSKKGNKAPAEGKLEGYTAEELAFFLSDDNGPEAQAYKDRKKVRERAREGGREGRREREAWDESGGASMPIGHVRVSRMVVAPPPLLPARSDHSLPASLT